MEKNYVWKSKYFCGNEISPYGLEEKRVDYATLAKSFDCVLNNTIFGYDVDGWEIVNGAVDNSEEITELENAIVKLENKRDIISATDYEDEQTKLDLIEEIDEQIRVLNDEVYDLQEDESPYNEVMQWYIISAAGAEILESYTDELVYYNENLDIYLWAVFHYGTSWNYVLTDIVVDIEND